MFSKFIFFDLAYLNMLQYSVLSREYTTEKRLYLYSNNKFVFWYTVYTCIYFLLNAFRIILSNALYFMKLNY